MTRSLTSIGAAESSWPFVPPRDIAASLTDLAEDLLGEHVPPPGAAERALERLRPRVRADEAVVWTFAGGHARRALYASSGMRTVPPALTLRDGAITLERLRRIGTVLCRFGEVSGIEELVPAGARSFIVTAAGRGTDVSGALVLGWATTRPPCDDATIERLRLIAALLVRAVAGTRPDASTAARPDAGDVPHRQIGARLVAAQERERSRIARELHDDVGQQVALLASKLEIAARDPELSRSRMRTMLADARRSLQDLATTVHNLSHALHPAKLRLLGLEPTLDTLCRNLSTETGVSIGFDRDGLPSDVPEDSALCVLRIAQEALQNAVKHSRARRIAVTIRGMRSHLLLRIADDGIGFDPLASHAAGLGLVTMRERVELSGGTLTIDSSRGRGTAVEAVVPMMRTARDPAAG